MRDPRSGVAGPLSASFADNGRKNIWARNETASDQPELLSPRRPVNPIPHRTSQDVFEDLDEEDHGEDLLPSSLSDLLTPRERARRLSRRDSNESFSASPSRNAFLWNSGERLAQSAGPTMGPGFLQGLWSAEGADARKAAPAGSSSDFTYGEGAAQPLPRASLLSAQRSPTSQQDAQQRQPEALTTPPFVFRPAGDPHSPGTRALQQHAPGQSLPGGLANALSRLHLHGPRTSSGLAHGSTDAAGATGEAAGAGDGPEQERASAAAEKRRDEQEEEGLFAMDG
jgi:cleavage and polyadenylation specificity factor subunit 4